MYNFALREVGAEKARKAKRRCDAGSKRATEGSSFYDHAVTRRGAADLKAYTDGMCDGECGRGCRHAKKKE